MHHQNPLLLKVVVLLTIFHQYAEVLGDLEITPLTNESYCYIQTHIDGMNLIHGNGSIPCKFKLKSLSGIIISVPPGDITGTDYVYIERVDPYGTSYFAFMGSHQKICETYFDNETILHLRGHITVSLHEAMANYTTNKSKDNFQNAFNNNSYRNQVGEEKQASCASVEEIDSVIHCSSKKSGWQMIVSSRETVKYVLGTRLHVYNETIDCRFKCSCFLGDRKFGYNCDAGFLKPDTNNLVLYPQLVSHLDLSGNYMNRLESNAFKAIGNNVTFLSLKDNKLSKIETGTFDYVPHLLHLNLRYNNLTSLAEDCFQSLHNLSVLILMTNKLATLPVRLFENQHNLEYFNIRGKRSTSPDYNYIRLLEKLETNQFVNTKLVELWLQFNALTVLQVGVFENLIHLRSLYLGYNNLVDLQVGVFDSVYNLNVLALQDNSLSNLGLGLFDNLTDLYYILLSKNKLVELQAGLFDNLSNMLILVLHTNPLVALHRHLFAKLNNLNNLQLKENQLAILDVELFANLQRLTELDLGNNSLSSLNKNIFQNLHNLMYLYLNINNIRHLVAGTFANMTSLQILSLAHNKVAYLPFHIFLDLTNLLLLSLESNNLQKIPQLSHMISLTNINLINNPLTKIEPNPAIHTHTNIFVDKYEVCACFFNTSYTKCYNQVKPSAYYTCNRLLSLPMLTVFIWIIGLSALLGNAFVLWWKQFKQKPENQVQSYLLSNLAMSDFLMGVYMIIIASADVFYGKYFPFYAESWRTGVVCKIAGILSITSSETSVLLVTLISIDRFITIRFPYSMHKLKLKSTRIISAFVWILSLLIALVASFLAGKNSSFYDITHVCIGLPLAQVHIIQTKRIEIDRSYKDGRFFEEAEVSNANDVPTRVHEQPGLFFSITIFIGLNVLCFLLILACYEEIIRVVCQSTKKSSRQREMAEEVRMTMKVSAIVLTDFLCWFPICILSALRQANAIAAFPPDVFAWMVTFVLPINSAINPFLYTIGTVISERCSKPMLPQAYIASKMEPLLSRDTKYTSISSQGTRKCSDQSSAGQNIPMGVGPQAKCQSKKSSGQIGTISQAITEESHAAPLVEEECYEI